MTISGLGKREPQLSGDNIFVAKSAFVIGDVKISDNVSIWFGAVLRGDIEEIRIRGNTNLQESCVVHTDYGSPVMVGENVTIGHQAVLHGCTIGDNTLVGIGATILNRAVIGKNCIIGAGALVPEGSTIPDSSCVLGIPGKVKRSVTPKEVEHTKENSRLYVGLIEDYKKSGFNTSKAQVDLQ